MKLVEKKTELMIILQKADESTIEEIVIDSIVDKIAGGEAAHDNTAGEQVEELTVDPSVELAVLEAAERIDGEAGEVSSKKLSLIRLLSLQLIKLPEARQLVTKRPKKARLYWKPRNESTKKLKDLGSNPGRGKTIDCL